MDTNRKRVRTNRKPITKPWPDGVRHPMFGKKLSRARPVEDRFWDSVTPGPEGECWTWRGARTRHGYGQLFSHYRYDTDSHYGRVAVPVMAHQVSYRIHKGEVPEGLVIDHMCMNKLCVNPNHLRAVTPRTNALENSNSMPARNARKPACKHGHPFSPENTYLRVVGNSRQRFCLTCHPRLRKHASTN